MAIWKQATEQLSWGCSVWVEWDVLNVKSSPFSVYFTTACCPHGAEAPRDALLPTMQRHSGSCHKEPPEVVWRAECTCPMVPGTGSTWTGEDKQGLKRTGPEARWWGIPSTIRQVKL